MSCTSGIKNDELLKTLAYTGNHNLKQRHTLMSVSAKNKISPLGQFEYTNLGFNIASIWMDNYYQQDW